MQNDATHGHEKIPNTQGASRDKVEQSVYHIFNSVSRGFVGGGETSSTRQVLNIDSLPEITNQKVVEVVVIFSKEVVSGVHPHNDYLMVISIKYEE